MNAREFAASVSGFANKQHTDKILLFGWYLHTHKAAERFSVKDVSKCYADANLSPPANIHVYFRRMADKSRKEFLQDRQGYRLPQPTRDRFDAQLLGRTQAAQLTKLLSDLPSQVPSASEREFLVETLNCYSAGANRAAIVMGWNLAYDHLCGFILAKHLPAFNAQLASLYPKQAAVAKRTDFEKLKEFETVKVAGGAGVVTANQRIILEEKLRKRNMAAHPSSVVFTPAQAEDVITDLTQNIVLALN